MKKIISRFLSGFCCSIAITLCLEMIILLGTGETPMLPEFVAKFESEMIAFAVQLLLVGVMSGVTAAGTVILELKRPGILVQSILFLIVMLAAWIPVACYAWGFHKYLASMFSSLVSIVATYGICLGIQYKQCRQDVQEINRCLNKKEV